MAFFVRAPHWHKLYRTCGKTSILDFEYGLDAQHLCVTATITIQADADDDG